MGGNNVRYISPKLRFEVLKKSNFKCSYCGKTSDDVRLVIDHVIPVSKNGTKNEDNLVASCELCNSGKGSILLTKSKNKIKQNHPLIGKFFHTYKGLELQWQGVVLDSLPGDMLLVQLFEWFWGEPSDQVPIWIYDISNWKFYDDEESWKEAYRRYEEQRRVTDLRHTEE